MDLNVIDGWYVLPLPKQAVLVLTKAQFIEGLRRGKWWRRRQALQPRHATMQARSAARREEKTRGRKD
jgi:hypothetical protein